LHVKVHPAATAVVAAVNPIQHAPASTVWRAVAVVVLAAMVAVVAVVDLAAVAVAAGVVALAAVAAAAAMVAAAMAVAVRSAVDQPRLNVSLAISPSMVGNGPIIELHLSAPQFSVLGYPAPHSGAPHLE
jgi:hypothetical protein